MRVTRFAVNFTMPPIDYCSIFETQTQVQLTCCAPRSALSRDSASIQASVAVPAARCRTCDIHSLYSVVVFSFVNMNELSPVVAQHPSLRQNTMPSRAQGYGPQDEESEH